MVARLEVDNPPVPAIPPWPSVTPRWAVMTVSPMPPRHACRAGGASRAGGAGGARWAGQTLLDAVPLQGDAPCLELVDLLLVGDDHSCLRDEHDGQRCADCKAALRAAPRLIRTSHIIPDVV